MNAMMIPADPALADAMLPLMAPEDRGRLPCSDLAGLVKLSEVSWLAVCDGHPVCVGGVVGPGVAWMISTPELNRRKRFFLRQSRVIMALIASRFDSIRGVVDTRYPRSIHWLGWLGFTLGEPVGRGDVQVVPYRWSRT